MLQTCSVDIFIHYAGPGMKFPASAERIPVPLGSDTMLDVKKKRADKILISAPYFFRTYNAVFLIYCYVNFAHNCLSCC